MLYKNSIVEHRSSQIGVTTWLSSADAFVYISQCRNVYFWLSAFFARLCHVTSKRCVQARADFAS